MPLILWRIAQSKFATLTGNGGLYASGRWHPKGHRIIYTAQSESLAILETLVHFDRTNPPVDLVLIKILAETRHAGTIESPVPKGWRNDQDITQNIGQTWLMQNRSAMLRVPSALSQSEYNYLLNPEHPEFHHIEIAQTTPLFLDQRLSF